MKKLFCLLMGFMFAFSILCVGAFCDDSDTWTTFVNDSGAGTEIIDADDVNPLFLHMTGNFHPRNPSGSRNSSEAYNLGSSTYNWNNLYVDEIYTGTFDATVEVNGCLSVTREIFVDDIQEFTTGHGITTSGLHANGEIIATGSIEGATLTASLFAHSIDVLSSYETGVVDGDIITLNFAFAPSVIMLYFNGMAVHTPNPNPDDGQSSGLCKIFPSKTADTFTSIMSHTGTRNTTLADVGIVCDVGDSTYLVFVTGGYDGATGSNFKATGAWDVSEKKLTLTMDETNTETASSLLQIMAVAYR